ncbi:Uncharacterized protein SCF082_LOCUS5884, partial [Durusdinium trenchii]
VSLSLTLTPELLRGTPLPVALSGFCQHWVGLSAGSEGGDLYRLSKAVKTIDVFLSHDWETSRWMKLLALLLYFNSEAAAIASLLFSLVLGVVKTQLGERLSNLWMFSCYLVFLIFLFFWQRIRTCFVSPWIVFLDKLCIHQENEELKQQGILGLGAFVHASDKLLVLWSRRTFSRLWCAYEVGCFLSRTRPQEKLEILPVTIAAIIYLNAILWHLLVICFRWTLSSVNAGAATSGTPEAVIYVCLVVVPFASILLPLLNYLGMTLMDDFDQIQECRCFCCSHHHTHPLTGHEMICDRQLVYASLTDLYRVAAADVGVDPLEKFNREVRERLGPRILRKLQVDLPMRYMVSLVLVGSLPLLSELIWDLSQGPQMLLQGADYAAWCSKEILEFLQPCMAMIFAFTFTNRLWKLRKVRACRRRKVCLSICLSPIQGILAGSVWASFEMIRAMSEESSFLPLLPFLVALVLNVLLHYV